MISINAICKESTLDTDGEYTLLLQNAIYALKSNSVPVGDDTVQICFIMHHGYHHNCVNLTIEEVKKYKGTSEFWMCDYNDAFADIQF